MYKEPSKCKCAPGAALCTQTQDEQTPVDNPIQL